MVSVSPGERDKICTEEVICWLKLVKASLAAFGSAGACGLELWCSVVGDLHPTKAAQASTTNDMQSAGTTLGVQLCVRDSGVCSPFVFCMMAKSSPLHLSLVESPCAVKTNGSRSSV